MNESDTEASDAGRPHEGNAALRPLREVEHLTEDTALKLAKLIEGSVPVQRLRASQLLSGVLGAVGFALFVVGVEQAAQDIPLISDPYGSIAIGLALLLATGLLLRKLAG